MSLIVDTRSRLRLAELATVMRSVPLILLAYNECGEIGSLLFPFPVHHGHCHELVHERGRNQALVHVRHPFRDHRSADGGGKPECTCTLHNRCADELPREAEFCGNLTAI